MLYNINMSSCIHSASSIGYETYYNVCSDTHSIVPWGSLDWIFFSVLAAIGIGVVSATILGITAAIMEW